MSPRSVDEKKVTSSTSSGAGDSGALRPRTPLSSTTDGGSGVNLSSEASIPYTGSSQKEKANLGAAGDSPIDEDSFRIHRQDLNSSLSQSRIEYSVEGFDISREEEDLAPSSGDAEFVEAETEAEETHSAASESPTTAVIDENAPQEESEDARIARELAESEALAWQMMQQEADNAYHMQMEYMRTNRDNMSQEDYEALNQIVSESALPAAAATYCRCCC